MSPILVRPVREQFEHDRIIRTLQTKFRRRFAVQANPGDERVGFVKAGGTILYPDLVMADTQGQGRVQAIVEVETSESINHLEAMAQWVAFGRSRIPFHLYVPVSGVDAARRLCAEHDVPLTELWSYYPLGEQIRFTAIVKAPASAQASRAAESGAARKPSSGTRTSRQAAPVKGAARSRSAGGSRKAAARKAPARPPAKRVSAAKKPARTPAKRAGAASSGRTTKSPARKAVAPRKGSASVKRLRSAAKRK